MNKLNRKEIKKIFDELDIDLSIGVKDSDLENRKKQFGTNKIEPKKRENILILFLKELKNPLNAILILAGILTLSLGEHLDMFVIFAAVLVNVCITLFQESRTNKTFQKLHTSKVFDVLVLRNGQKEVVQAGELVVGDIVYLNAGDKIPADVRVIEYSEFMVDESSFTGEAENVEKQTGDLSFSGSIVKRGSAKVIVTAVGLQSEFGQILSELNAIEKKPSAIAEKMKKITMLIGAIAIFAVILVILGGVYNGLKLHTLIILGISVAVSAIPEGLGASVSASLTVGMHRLLKKGILVKDLVSTETMASVDTILTDKTGTLTEGNMSMKKLFVNQYSELSERDFLLHSFLASDVSYDVKHEQFVGDEMDIAIAHKLLDTTYFDPKDVQREFTNMYTTLKVLPFSSENKFFARLVESKKTQERFVFVKGAPEIILAAASNLSDEQRIEYKNILDNEQGVESRFLGFGYKQILDHNISELELNLSDIHFTGFASFLDPIKKSVEEVLDHVKKMDLNLIMITGDSKEVAMAVAQKTGLVHGDDMLCLEGSDIQDLSKDELYEKTQTIKIFARVSPQDKLKLAETFIERGHRIAMTGDGVNDILALSQADIGITFANASEAARESASLVLEKNDFSLILSAIDEARNIIKNIRKTVIYLLSSSFSAVLVIFGALVIGGPMPFLAVHILWANIVEEGLLNFAFIFGENKKEEYSGRINSQILTPKVKKMLFAVGIADALLLLLLYFFLFKSGFTETKIQSLMFLALSLNFSVVAYALTDLRKTIFRKDIFSNKYLNFAVFIGVGLITLAIGWEPLRNILQLEVYSRAEILYLILLAFVNLFIVEVCKFFIFTRPIKIQNKKPQ